MGLLGGLLVSSCDRREVGTAGGKVSWPQLMAFDAVAYRIDGFARAGDLATVRASRHQLIEAGQALTPETIPGNAADPQQVAILLADLTSLVEGIASETIEDASLTTLVFGLHPVTERLMEAAGMPHTHANEGQNGGYLHPLFHRDGTQVGTLEIKLHDDAGDLEAWITQGGHDGEPWRMPLDTVLSLTFPDIGKEVNLAVRDRERNNDESGQSTIRDGATAYFIFPGETGADASWLSGADLAANAELQFEDTTTGSFILRPHVHHDHGD